MATDEIHTLRDRDVLVRPATRPSANMAAANAELSIGAEAAAPRFAFLLRGVHLGFHRNTGERLAIPVIPPEQRRRRASKRLIMVQQEGSGMPKSPASPPAAPPRASAFFAASTAAAPDVRVPAAAAAPACDRGGEVVWAVREPGLCWPALLFRSPEAAFLRCGSAQAIAVPPDYDHAVMRVAIFLDARSCAIVPLDHTVGFEDILSSCHANVSAAVSSPALDFVTRSLSRAICDGCTLAGCLPLLPAHARAALQAAQQARSTVDASAWRKACSFVGCRARVPLSYWLCGTGEVGGQVLCAVRIENDDYHGWGCRVRFSPDANGRDEWDLPVHDLRRFATSKPTAAVCALSGAADASATPGRCSTTAKAAEGAASHAIDINVYREHAAAAIKMDADEQQRSKHALPCAACRRPTRFTCPLCKVRLCHLTDGNPACFVQYHCTSECVE